MVKIRKRGIPLVVQEYKLKKYFPESKCFIQTDTLAWKGYLQPSELSQKYLIKLVYKRGNHPDVYVAEPKPLALAYDKTRLEHVYNTKKQHICIYYRRAKEWDETKFIADTIIPWTSEWLLHYEYWVATGSWHGGGIHIKQESIHLHGSDWKLKLKVMATKVTGKAAASAASKVLRDGRTSSTSKTAAGSALSQREKGGKKK